MDDNDAQEMLPCENNCDDAADINICDKNNLENDEVQEEVPVDDQQDSEEVPDDSPPACDKENLSPDDNEEEEDHKPGKRKNKKRRKHAKKKPKEVQSPTCDEATVITTS